MKIDKPLTWLDKRYHSLNFALREIFNEKTLKLSLDGGFTCPNRDGTIGSRGCIFCSEKGSGDFAGDRSLSLKKQIESQQELLSEKWPNGTYIGYFQNFTNTYDSLENLKMVYEEVLSHPDIKGLAIATRPDALTDEIIDYLEELSKKTFLWIELGLQSIHESSSDFIRRGYSIDLFESTFEKLKSKNINTVVHLILGLPGESKAQIIKSVDYISKLKPWGIKLHLLHILKNTDLASYYEEHPFTLFEMDEYINLIVECLEHLDPSIVIHRLTGDGGKDSLLAPRWTLNKRAVLNGIDKLLREKNSFQGRCIIQNI